MLFGKKKTVRVLDYDRNEKTPVIHCSICNGEQVAGFKDRATGRFVEAALIRDERELDAFLKHYGLKEIKKEY